MTIVSEPATAHSSGQMPGDGASAKATVAILMCTKDGADFLPRQLESIKHQTYPNWLLYASDDGSSDQTKGILVQFAKRYVDRVFLREGPHRGFPSNFLSLATDPSVRADYFAYCDQDDFWYPDKLSRALEWFRPLSAKQPGLYGSRVELVDVNGQILGQSPLFRRKPSFKSALVQSLAGGNTMFFNLSAKLLLEQAGAVDIVAHDWWTYQLISAAGGIVVYDPKPSVQYRQHNRNLIGSNTGLMPRLQRIGLLMSDRFRDWNTKNITALDHCTNLFTPESQRVLSLFKIARSRKSVVPRLTYLYRSGVYRQTWLGQLGLIAAGLMGKF
jgi:glycosyltransferase involved in cell wall biosynthesis